MLLIARTPMPTFESGLDERVIRIHLMGIMGGDPVRLRRLVCPLHFVRSRCLLSSLVAFLTLL